MRNTKISPTCVICKSLYVRFTTDVAITEDVVLKNGDALKTAEVTLKAVEAPVEEAIPPTDPEK